MPEVGVRELRNGLSRWLVRVKDGEAVTVTERGKPIARIMPVGERKGYDELVRAGVIIPAKNKGKRYLPKKLIQAKGSVSELVKDQRR
jgi:prevent-host-death family protein